jgi:hypothetical protein
LLPVPVFGRDFYAPANRVATFLIDIFYAKSAVTIFYRKARKYAFIRFDYKMIFPGYLLCHLTAKIAVNIALFAVTKVEVN